MNRKENLLIILWLCCTAFFSCTATKSYFKTPNDVSKMPAVVTFANGVSKTGLLTILFENDIETSGSLISFKPVDSTREETIKFSDIRSYQLNGDTYVAKMVNLYSNGVNRGLFAKRLSSDSFPIQLYQLEQRFKSNPTGEDRDFYYVSVPSYSPTQLIELQSALLVPSFESKMAAFVKDCPQLAEKIRTGVKGYSYGFLTATFKKVEVMKRILEEYYQCSK